DRAGARAADDPLAAAAALAREQRDGGAGARPGAGGGGMSDTLASSVRRAVIWRSGSQVVAQLVAWGSTLAVVRILDPSDYGLFALTQVVLAFLSFLNG